MPIINFISYHHVKSCVFRIHSGCLGFRISRSSIGANTSCWNLQANQCIQLTWQATQLTYHKSLLMSREGHKSKLLIWSVWNCPHINLSLSQSDSEPFQKQSFQKSDKNKKPQFKIQMSHFTHDLSTASLQTIPMITDEFWVPWANDPKQNNLNNMLNHWMNRNQQNTASKDQLGKNPSFSGHMTWHTSEISSTNKIS